VLLLRGRDVGDKENVVSWYVEIFGKARDNGVAGTYSFDCDAVRHCGMTGPIHIAEAEKFSIDQGAESGGWTFGKGNRCYCPEHAHLGGLRQQSLFEMA
jgi:hypothetical protein